MSKISIVKKSMILIAATPLLLFVTGCNNNASMENPSTNTPAAQPPAMVNTNPPTGAEPVNPVPAAGALTNSAAVETNNPATTNNMNTTTNMTPP